MRVDQFIPLATSLQQKQILIAFSSISSFSQAKHEIAGYILNLASQQLYRSFKIRIQLCLPLIDLASHLFPGDDDIAAGGVAHKLTPTI